MKIANQINNQQFNRNQSFGMKFTPQTLIEMGTMAKLKQGGVSAEHLSTIASLCSHTRSDEFLVSISGLVNPKRNWLSRLIFGKVEPVLTMTVSSTKYPSIEAIYAKLRRGNSTDNLTAALDLLKKDAQNDYFQINALGAIDYVRKSLKKVVD